MTIPLVVLRPEPGLTATVNEARKLGFSVISSPLFAIEPRVWDAPRAAAIDALLIGSANAIRHGGNALQALRNKPVYAVGETTAGAAREAGFSVAETGDGGLQPLLDRLAGRGLRLLRLAGAEHVSLTPPADIELITRVVYASVPQPLPDGLAETLASGAVVLLHSAAAARHFAAACDRRGIARAAVALAALAPRIADAAGEGWRAVESAAEPSDAALLALAGHMCHSPR